MGALSRLVWRFLIACLSTCDVSPLLAAEIPSRIYTTQDGLVRDDVNRIRRDSRGYLWFGTSEGISIFDGYQFTNYTVKDGLPNRVVQDILETRSGEYWIATYGGLCRFNPGNAPGLRFTPVHLTTSALGDRVNILIERRDGSIWFGSEGGLWQLRRSGAYVSAERIQLPSLQNDSQQIHSLIEDREGNLWVASGSSLYAIWRDGRITRFADGDPVHESTLDVLQDNQGRIWTATQQGICRINPHPANHRKFVERVYAMRRNPTALFESSDGKLWVSSTRLFEFNPDAPDSRDVFQPVATSLAADFLGPLAEDADHNLWATGSGALKLTRHGFTTYSTADGLDVLRVYALTQDRAGRLCAITNGRTGMAINEFDGSRFTSVPLYPPPGVKYAWGDAQISFQDGAGDWWIPTFNGLLRFAPPARLADLAHARPKNTYSTQEGLPQSYVTKEGLPEAIVLRLLEDSRGDVWIGLFRGLARWQRSTGRIQAFSISDGLRYVTEQPPMLGTPQSLAEDRTGQIWIGFHPFGLARYRNGRFDFYTKTDGLPEGQITGLYSDHAGRLWIASSQGGAARIDDVAATRPSFHTYTVAQGLSSDQIITVVEDTAGRIYLGGGNGVDRLIPESGHVRHFTTPDGIPPVRVQYSLRDRTGALWFGSGLGLSRYLPEPDRPSEPQPPLIRLLQIAGRPSSVSPLGASAIDGIRLKPSENNLHIEFASLHFASGEVLRYQYRLEGADGEWSPPTEQRTVNYSSLSPGSYRFVVKAINGEGLSSPQAATIGFVILPPVWRQAWFIVLVSCSLAAMLYAGHRYRVRQLIQLERIRTRLASDLHDDIGSGLSEIAILTEVAEVQPVAAGGDLMRRAGDRARQLREAMSDIVWSVDPQHGNLTDLIDRVRQTVFSLLETNGTRVSFIGPEEAVTAGLPPDRARHVLLIAKEALTNILKHADAAEVSVSLKVEERTLVLEVRDDGRGFDPAAPHGGMGLRNLRRRARESGGELTVDSSPGHGTRLRLLLPLR